MRALDIAMTSQHQEYPWPSTTEEERHQMLIGGENDLLSDLYELGHAVASAGARRHVAAGLSRRLLILQECRLWLRAECNKHQTTVSPYTATDLSIYVNAYYVNLCGALDNLAWALVYELKLAEPVDEEDKRTQRLAALTSKEFRRQVAQAHPPIAARIEASMDWHWEVRKLRDPAAHRLPLTVVAGVLDEEQHAEVQRLCKLASEATQSGDFRTASQLRFQASTLGTFHPWLENPEGSQHGFYYVPNLIARDQAFYVDLVGAVATMLRAHLVAREARDPAGQRSVLKGRTSWPLGAYLKCHEPFRFSSDISLHEDTAR